MLHLIFQSSVDLVVLNRIDTNDDVVFLENAVFSIRKNTLFCNEIQHMQKNDIHFYVLNEEIETRGINISELIIGVKVIDYSGLVLLTEKNKIISTWN